MKRGRERDWERLGEREGEGEGGGIESGWKGQRREVLKRGRGGREGD